MRYIIGKLVPIKKSTSKAYISDHRATTVVGETTVKSAVDHTKAQHKSSIIQERIFEWDFDSKFLPLKKKANRKCDYESATHHSSFFAFHIKIVKSVETER